ncbi:MAG: cobaltochelatase subunit CobN, partial [Spongiibacteraceae bacterium]|nr:cobaltochelatase subunit CobN [Spongiibacteraceae bacterium]
MSHTLRWMALLYSVLGAMLLASILPAQAAERITLTYLMSDGQMPGVNQALKAVLAEHPELRGRVRVQFITESMADRLDRQAVLASDVLVLDMMNQALMERVSAEHDVDLLRDIARRGQVLAVGSGTVPIEYFTGQGARFDERAQAFWQNSGASNQRGLLKFVLTLAGVDGLTLPDPEPSLEFGYYYPGDVSRGTDGRVFADWTSFDAWRRQQPGYRPGAVEVAVPFYKASYYGGETTVLDAIVREIERQGANAVPLFGYPGKVAMERLALDEQGRPRIDVALSFLFRFADFEATQALERIGVPLINLVTLYGRSEAEWRASTTGLSPFEGTYQVAVPELAGLIAPTVVGSREKVYDIETGLAVVAERPVSGRIEMAVARALRYAELRRKPAADKSVAILYYNYPTGKSNIGASYLNVAESLSAILQRLRAEGYDTGSADLSAAALLTAMVDGARNIGGYAPGELEQLVAEHNPVLVSVTDYRRWFDALAPALRDKVVKDWGEPEQSTLMTVERNGSRQLVIPALRFGKVLLQPQPSRAWGEDAQKMFHASDLAPHHQYIATYAWLREQAGVAAVIHLGTHGTHEWLDGKDVGLNEEDA